MCGSGQPHVYKTYYFLQQIVDFSANYNFRRCTYDLYAGYKCAQKPHKRSWPTLLSILTL